ADVTGREIVSHEIASRRGERVTVTSRGGWVREFARLELGLVGVLGAPERRVRPAGPVFIFMGRGVAPGECEVYNLRLVVERDVHAAAFFEPFSDRLDGVSARLEGSEDVRTVGLGDYRR